MLIGGALSSSACEACEPFSGDYSDCAAAAISGNSRAQPNGWFFLIADQVQKFGEHQADRREFRMILGDLFELRSDLAKLAAFPRDEREMQIGIGVAELRFGQPATQDGGAFIELSLHREILCEENMGSWSPVCRAAQFLKNRRRFGELLLSPKVEPNRKNLLVAEHRGLLADRNLEVSRHRLICCR